MSEFPREGLCVSILLKNAFRNNTLSCFERYREVSHTSSARFPSASGVGMILPAPLGQTIIGSRATASKRLPKLSTRGETLSAGPRSTIRT